MRCITPLSVERTPELRDLSIDHDQTAAMIEKQNWRLEAGDINGRSDARKQG